jgi:hypothetical protein
MKGKIVYGPKGKKLFFIDGKPVSRRRFDRAFPNRVCDLIRAGKGPGGQENGAWPMRSEALAVHPRQVEQANARNARHGVATRYDPKTGHAIIPSREDRRKLLKVEGFRDNDGGYSD